MHLITSASSRASMRGAAGERVGFYDISFEQTVTPIFLGHSIVKTLILIGFDRFRCHSDYPSHLGNCIVFNQCDQPVLS